MNIIIVILLILIIGVTSTYAYTYNVTSTFSNDTVIKSDIDNNKYTVRDLDVKEYPKDLEIVTEIPTDANKFAADYLALIRTKMDSLVDYMKKHELPDREISDRLNKRWRTCELREMSSNENSVAYTLNKGDEMRICIRNSNKFEDFNTSLFVILHELAHLMSISYDHTDEFRENFYYIVHLAARTGYYSPQNFVREPVMYCGIEINTTPCSKDTCFSK